MCEGKAGTGAECLLMRGYRDGQRTPKDHSTQIEVISHRLSIVKCIFTDM